MKSRRILHTLVVWLLAAWPLLVTAQQINWYEYWFDDDFAGRIKENVSPTEKLDLNIALDTDHLSDGFHRLSYRFHQNDGMYGAISSGVFWHLREYGEVAKLEYWFDDDFEGRIKENVSPTEELDIHLSINTDHLSDGFHRLSYRFLQTNGMYSAISTGVFWRILNEGDVAKLEYWCDDDFAGRSEIHVLPDEQIVFQAELPTEQLGYGLHRLNYRIQQTNGMYSAISSAMFFCHRKDQISKLEYWFDGDYAHRQTIDGRTTYQGVSFLSDLNGSALTPGGHVLYYRAASADGPTATAIHSVPILTKLKTYDEAANGQLPKVMRYTFAIDDQLPTTALVDNPGYIVDVETDINTSGLTAGKHLLTTTFWNSEEQSATKYSFFNASDSGYKLPTPDKKTFTATDITGTGFKASWGGVEGAECYDVQVRKVGGSYETPVFKRCVLETTVDVSGLEPSTSYQFQVRARNGNRAENSDWSASIPQPVVTTGNVDGDLVITAIEGIDGQTPLTVGQPYTYQVTVRNYGTYEWKGAFYLKDGEQQVACSQSIPTGAALPIEFNYTPKTAGSKALVLYYQTGGHGDGFPVSTKEGADNIMLVKVNDVAGTVTYDLRLQQAIVCPSTIDWNTSTKITATVVNNSKTNWTGYLMFTDNARAFYTTEEITIKAGKSKTMSCDAWTPSTADPHSISAYYRTSNTAEWTPIAANGFANPVMVQVENVNVPTTADGATIALITKDCAPEEVNEGDIALYYFRIKDKSGQPLKGVTAQFTCNGSRAKDEVETYPSDENGCAVLQLETTGANAFAKRGDNVLMFCERIVDENGKVVQTFASSSDDNNSEFRLSIHQSSDFANETGLDDVESVTIKWNRAFKGKVNSWLSGKLSNPLSYTFKWNNGELLTTVASEVSGEASEKIDIESLKIASEGGLYGGQKTSTTYNWSNWKKTSFALLLGLLGSDRFTNPATLNAINAIWDWFGIKHGDDTYFADITTGDEISYFLEGSISTEGKFEKSNIFKKALDELAGVPTLFPDYQIPTDELKGELSLSGKGSYKYVFNKEVNDFTKSKKTFGNNRQMKLNFTGDAKAVFNKLIPVIGRKIPKNAIRTDAGYYEPIFDHNFGIKANISMTCEDEEVYKESSHQTMDKISSSFTVDAGINLSFKDLTKYLPKWVEDKEENQHNSTFSGAFNVSLKRKISSSGGWATVLTDLSKPPRTLNSLLGDIYPHFSDSWMLPLPYYWNMVTDFNTTLTAIRNPFLMAHRYNIKDIMKIDEQETDNISANLTIPIFKFKTKLLQLPVDLTLDMGASIGVSFNSNTSYYSPVDDYIFPVVIRSNNTAVTVFNKFINFMSDKFTNIFSDDEENEIGEHIEKISKGESYHFEQGWQNGQTLYNGMMCTNKKMPHVDTKLKSPRLAGVKQNDICTFTFHVNNGTPNFNDATTLSFSHYYPAGCLLGITEEEDTLFVLSEVCELRAQQGSENLIDVPHGSIPLLTTVGADDLTPFGFSEETPLGIYQMGEGNGRWHYVGEAGTPIQVDRLGYYMMATSIKNDLMSPEINANLDTNTKWLHLYVTDNIGVQTSSLKVYVNGQEKRVSMIDKENFGIQLSEKEMNYQLTLYATVQDLAGNTGTLFLMFNMDKPDNIKEVTEEDGCSALKVMVSRSLLKVEGAEPNVKVTLFNMDGRIMAEGRTNAQGKMQRSMNLPAGIYVVTLSNGKSKKFLVK